MAEARRAGAEGGSPPGSARRVLTRRRPALEVLQPPPGRCGGQGDDCGQDRRVGPAQVGKPYVWGAESPALLRLPGLVYWSHGQVGLKMMRTTWDQWTCAGIAVHESPPGDVFANTYRRGCPMWCHTATGRRGRGVVRWTTCPAARGVTVARAGSTDGGVRLASRLGPRWALVALLLTAASALAQGSWYVAAPALEARAEPSGTAEVVGVLRSGAEVRVSETRGVWRRVTGATRRARLGFRSPRAFHWGGQASVIITKDVNMRAERRTKHSPPFSPRTGRHCLGGGG